MLLTTSIHLPDVTIVSHKMRKMLPGLTAIHVVNLPCVVRLEIHSKIGTR